MRLNTHPHSNARLDRAFRAGNPVYVGKNADDELGELSELLEVLPGKEDEEQGYIFSNINNSRNTKVLSVGAKRGDVTGSNLPIKDNSASLTRRLVSASNQFEVRIVIGEAFREMVSLRMAAIMGDDQDAQKARIIIRNIERVIRRANRKVADLDKEASLRRRQKDAALSGKGRRAKQIEHELRQRMHQRRRRENGYLKGLLNDAVISRVKNEKKKGHNKGLFFQQDIAAQSQIAARAKAMAATELSASFHLNSDSAASAALLRSQFGGSNSFGSFSGSLSVGSAGQGGIDVLG